MGWRIVRRWGRERGLLLTRGVMRRLLRGGIRRLGVFGWRVVSLGGGCGLVILRGGRGRRFVGWRGVVRGVGGEG